MEDFKLKVFCGRYLLGLAGWGAGERNTFTIQFKCWLTFKLFEKVALGFITPLTLTHSTVP